MATSLSERIDVPARNDSRNENSPYHGELEFKHTFRSETDGRGNTTVWSEVVFGDSAASCLVSVESGASLNALFVYGMRTFQLD